jgi:exodeoxyribonuclease V alpha subunit
VDPKSGGFRRSGDHPLACDLLVVDEASMVDILLMQALLKAVPDHAALLIVGDINHSQVLCPMNRGGIGPQSLNIELQKALKPVRECRVERFGWTFAPKVMQIENDYDRDVYDGDIGYVADIDPEEGELSVCFDSRAVSYGFGELDALVPAYAATIHKSEGSEYPAVVIAVMTQHYAMLQRNLRYSGITHRRRLVVLVGHRMAIAIAVHNMSGRLRWLKLEERGGAQVDSNSGRNGMEHEQW